MFHSLALVFAHPDDETFATGGMLARYAAARVPWDLFCATDGDAGKSSVPVASREELGALRRNELRLAARRLGAREVVCAGHPDGALGAVDVDQLVGEIVAFLRRVRPAVVLTFGPEGAPTGHRDHKAICRFATSAVLLAGTAAFPEQLSAGLAPHRPARLCYVTWPVPGPGEAPRQEGQPIHVRIPVQRWHPRKLDAFFAHRTQLDHEAYFRREAMPATEDYFVAIGGPASGEDLFAGISSG